MTEPDPSKNSADDSRLGPFGWGLLASSAGVMLAITVYAWHSHVYDRSPVRQTQTLLTIVSFLKNGFTLAYETPIFGYPWRVPLEFPFYQGVAAAIARVTTVRAAYAAQAVTLTFFGLSLALVWRTLGQMGVPAKSRAIVISLATASPLYLFWSQTVTMESAALFFSLAHLDCLISYARTRRAHWLVLSMVAGSLAGAVKSTTFAGWLILSGGALIVYAVHRRGRIRRESVAVVATVGLAFLIPLLAMVAWTRYADAVKLSNATASTWISSRLRSYVFGTIEQRLSLGTWATILVGRPVQLLGSPLALLPLPWGLARRSRWRLHIAICLAGYLAPYLIFTNLHFIHDYYSYANGMLLIVAVGLSIASLMEQGQPHSTVAQYAAVPAILATMYLFFLTTFAPAYAYADGYPAAQLDFVRDSTSSEDAIAQAAGALSEVALRTERRVAHTTRDMLLDPRRVAMTLGPAPLGAVGLSRADASDVSFVGELKKTYGLMSLALPVFPECSLYLSTRNGPRLRDAAARARRTASLPGSPAPNDRAEGVVSISSGDLLSFWGAARYRCPVTKGQRIRVLLRSTERTLAFPVDRVNADPVERYRFRMMRAYDRWYDGTVDTSVSLRLSPYLLGAASYEVGLEVSPPPACAPAPAGIVWTGQIVVGAGVPE